MSWQNRNPGCKNIWGKTTTDAQCAIRDELADQEVKSLVCGPAGENLVAFANVMTGMGGVFLGATLPNFEGWPKVLYYNTGLEFTLEELWDIAERCNIVERLFNLREGLTREDLEKGDMINHGRGLYPHGLSAVPGCALHGCLSGSCDFPQ